MLNYNFHKNSFIIFCIRNFSFEIFLFYPRPSFHFSSDMNRKWLWTDFGSTMCDREMRKFLSLSISFSSLTIIEIFVSHFHLYSDHFVCSDDSIYFFLFHSQPPPEKRQHTTEIKKHFAIKKYSQNKPHNTHFRVITVNENKIYNFFSVSNFVTKRNMISESPFC